MKKILFSLFAVAMCMTSCENSDWSYPDYVDPTDGSSTPTVYFAKQQPIRTLILGEDVHPNDLDNKHMCEIKATLSGVYENKSNVYISYEVDPNLLENKKSDLDVEVMPSNYYELLSDKMLIPAGSTLGGVQVKFTDAFFNDVKSLDKTYVIPIKMTGIVSGNAVLNEKTETNKLYTLFMVRYINPYHGEWLLNTDLTINGQSYANKFDASTDWVNSNKDIRYMYSKSYTQCTYPVYYTTEKGVKDRKLCDLVLTFNADGACTVTSGTEGFTATGSGQWTSKGEKNSWGQQDRDVITLEYSISGNGVTATAKEKLIYGSRNTDTQKIVLEEF